MNKIPNYNLECQKCHVQYQLDDIAFDKTCQNKHTFLFVCPLCGDYRATAIGNIPQEMWKEFIPAEQLDDVIARHADAMKSRG